MRPPASVIQGAAHIPAVVAPPQGAYSNLPRLSDSFTLGAALQHGAQGKTYLLNHSENGPGYVGKFPGEKGSWGEIDRVVAEGCRLITLSHPNIVKAVGLFADESGMPVLVTKQAPGKDLTTWLEDPNFRLTDAQSLSLYTQMVSALQYLESQGVVHRDINPNNLLLDINAATGELHMTLVDFGLQRPERTERRLSTVAVGLVGYMGPETYEDSEITYATDWIAAGLTLLSAMNRTFRRQPANVHDVNQELASVRASRGAELKSMLNGISAMTKWDSNARRLNALPILSTNPARPTTVPATIPPAKTNLPVTQATRGSVPARVIAGLTATSIALSPVVGAGLAVHAASGDVIGTLLVGCVVVSGFNVKIADSFARGSVFYFSTALVAGATALAASAVFSAAGGAGGVGVAAKIIFLPLLAAAVLSGGALLSSFGTYAALLAGKAYPRMVSWLDRKIFHRSKRKKDVARLT